MRRLKFISDNDDRGFPRGAHLIDAESGEHFQGVRSIAVQCDITTEFIPVMTIIVEGEVNMAGYAHEILEAKP